MRITAYKLLTLAILLLAAVRKKVGGSIGWEMRSDRDVQNQMVKVWFSVARGILIECCDCGLSHRFFESEKGSHAIPERPKGYDYKWRV